MERQALEKVAHCMDNYLWEENQRLGHELFIQEMYIVELKDFLDHLEAKYGDLMDRHRTLQQRFAQSIHDRDTLLAENAEMDTQLQMFHDLYPSDTESDSSQDLLNPRPPTRRRLEFSL